MPEAISPARRAEVIDALRRGTVPQAGLDLFAVGMERFERAIDEELDGVTTGRATFKAVRGEYGAGKTFFARWLTGFDLPKLTRLGGSIRDVYATGLGKAAAARIETLVDDAYIADLAAAVAGELGGQIGVAPRVFLRKLVADVLDRVAEFDDFDPRLHYKLTLSSSELTATERNAAAFRPATADDVDLDL